MCTVVVSVQPGEAYPVVLAANRDERVKRAWNGPGAWWPKRPDIVAGRDQVAGGSWMGINRHGVVATVLNRQGTLGQAPGKRSRGELPLIALAHTAAEAAAAAICQLDAAAWRGFNMVIADRLGAFFVRGTEQGQPESARLNPGCHMVTAHDADDPASPRIARHLPRFRSAPRPGPQDWSAWLAILADNSGPDGTEINRPERSGFGTVCASMIFLGAGAKFLFAYGPPQFTPFQPVYLPWDHTMTETPSMAR